MPNGAIHSMVGGLSCFAVATLDRNNNRNSCHNPLSAIGMGAVVGKLPNVSELSLKNPHHRQFLHSLAILGLVGYGTKKIYGWQQPGTLESIVRFLMPCTMGSMSHLTLDVLTSRSLPLTVKI